MGLSQLIGMIAMKILFTTDGSPCSETAFQHLLNDGSLPPDTQFKVLSVVEAIVGAYPVAEFYIDSMVEAEAALKEERKKLVAGLVARLKEKLPAAEVDGAVSIGFPADRILNEARCWGADLIVLGSHARKGLSHFILGSVAERVAREAECSVEIIRIQNVASKKATAKKVVASAK